MPRTTTLTAAAPGDSVTFDRTACGFSLGTMNHTVTVADAVTSYDVDIRIGGKWIRVDNATDALAAVATVLDQVGYDAVKVTCTAAGAVTLTSWVTV